MAGVELATAYVSIIPEVRSIKPGVRKAFSGAGGEANRAGRQMGDQFGSAASAGFESRWSRIRSSVASTAKFVAGALGTIGAVSIGTGIKTAAAMENADIAFTTMLGSGEKAGKFMKDLQDFAAKTPFDFPELQTASQSLVSAGIESKKVIPIMTTLGNVTSGMGTGQEGIKRATIAIQQMNAAQRIQAEDLNQLRDAGIPVYDLLAGALGKTKKEVAEMAQTGKLGKEELDAMMKALETGEGLERFNGMMEKQSQSLAGLWATLKDTFTMGMAEAVQPLMPVMKSALKWMIGFVEDNIPRIQKGLKTIVLGAQGLYNLLVKGDYTGALNKAFGWEEDSKAVDRLFDIRDAATGLFNLLFKGDYTGGLQRAFGWEEDSESVDKILDLRDAVSGFFKQLKGGDGGSAMKSFGDLLPTLAEGAGNLLKALPAFGPTFELLGKGLAFAANNVDLLAKAMPYLIAAFVAWKTLQAANTVIGRDSAIGMAAQVTSTVALTASNFALARSQKAVEASTVKSNAAQKAGLFTRIRATAATVSQTVAEKARTLAVKLGTAAQRVFNAVMAMNPLAKVVLVLTAVGAALFLLYKKNETFRKAVNAAWTKIRETVGAVAGWFTANVLPRLRAVWSAIGSGAKALWTTYIKPAFSSVRSGATSTFGFLQTWVWPTVKRVFGWIGNAIRLWWAGVKVYFSALRTGATATFGFLKTWVWPTVKWVFNAIVGAAKLWWAGVKVYFNFLRAIVRSVFGFLKTWAWPTVKWVFNAIVGGAKLWWAGVKVYFNFLRAIARSVFGFLKTWAWPTIKWVFNAIVRGAKLWWSGVKVYFNFLKRIASSVFGWIKNTGWPWIRAAFSAIGNAARSLYTKWIRPYFGNVLSRAKSVFGWIKRDGWGYIKGAFNNIGEKARWLWRTAKKPFDAMRSGFGKLKDAAVAARDGISTAWSKVNEAVRKPLRKAMTFIDTKFISKVKSMLRSVDLKDLAGRIPYLTPGGKGFAVGGYTGPGPRLKPAGIVHADEFVLKKEATNKLRKQIGLEGLNYMNQTGRMPELGGYDKGGIVALGKRIQQMGYHVSEHPAFGGVVPGAHSATGWHYKGGALDINADSFNSKFRNEKTALDRLNRILRSEGWNTIWQAPNHYDHLHVDIGNGQKGGLGGLSNLLSGFAGKVLGGGRKVLDNILDKVPGADTLLGKFAVQPFKKAVPAIFSKFKEAANLFGGDSGNLSFSSVAAGPNMMMGKALAAQAGWTGRQWTALRELWNRESNWNHRAANPSSGAYGIPQSLPASKMASAGGDWRTNAQTQIKWGLNYIRGRYGTPAAALAFHDRKNWYNTGGLVKGMLAARSNMLEFDSGGYLPRGVSTVVNNTGKPEPLKRMDLDDGDPVVPNITVLVQDVWTGEYHEARMRDIVLEREDFNNSVERGLRRG